jgi:hypothetical protein
VHGPAHGFVAAEGEGHVRQPARDVAAGQVLADPARGLDEVHRVIVVLLDPCRHREDIGIEDDVVGIEPDFVDQRLVGALADLDLALGGVGLTVLVKRHHHDRCAISLAGAGVLEELRLALLQEIELTTALP